MLPEKPPLYSFDATVSAKELWGLSVAVSFGPLPRLAWILLLGALGAAAVATVVIVALSLAVPRPFDLFNAVLLCIVAADFAVIGWFMGWKAAVIGMAATRSGQPSTASVHDDGILIVRSGNLTWIRWETVSSFFEAKDCWALNIQGNYLAISKRDITAQGFADDFAQRVKAAASANQLRDGLNKLGVPKRRS